MPCYHPIRMRQLAALNKNGKRSIVSSKDSREGKDIQLPCGRCVGCRLERARQWAMRCVHEMSLWRVNSYVTLTYDDNELVYGGQLHGILYPRHLVLFWKRLRKYGAKFRYFACGEYGDKLSRPHYHAIIFGYDFQDKKYHSSEGGYDYYYSDTLNRLWGHGNCIIGNATFESASYVARYVMKKRLGKTKLQYEKEGISPEYVVMSRRPGIGREWIDKYLKDVFPRDSISVRGHDTTPPKYYTERYKKLSESLLVTDIHPFEHADMIARRVKRAEDNFEQNTTKQLLIREHIKKRAIKSLTKHKL